MSSTFADRPYATDALDSQVFVRTLIFFVGAAIRAIGRGQHG